ncbi:MAG: peptidoglycan-binding domain-containing protein [Thiogranum sp.]
MSVTKNVTSSLVSLAVCALLVGCAGLQGERTSSRESDVLLAEKDQEIARLSSEIASMERSLSDEQNARVNLEASAKEQMLLPPEAKPGQCFARAFIPPRYEIETVRVKKSDASTVIETLPPQFEMVEERVLVKESSERLEVVPAVYEWIEERVLVRPASNEFETVPAQYRTETERVLDKPEHTVWKKGSGPITRIDEATGEIMCLVTIPASYKTVSKQVLVKDAETREIEIPAEYKMVKKRVMKTPPGTRKVVIPAEYKTVKVRKLLQPASSRSVDIPAEFQTVQRRNMIADGHVEWRPVLCETNMSSDVVRRIQSALDSEGYTPGPIDGLIGPQTMDAVKRYQQTKGLASGGLTLETLESLKVSL